MLAIQTDNLTRCFGRLKAVDRLCLNVPQGSVYGFLGPNGAGKSTTIRLLLGLIRPHGGEVRIFDDALSDNRSRLLGRVGALVESPSVYPHLTGRENLNLFCKLLAHPMARIDEVLGVVRLQDAADRPVKGYSTGMRQRLGLALALLPAPELLVLDEPTNGLDPAGIREMRELIRDMPERHGLTVLLSSHLLGEIEQLATHVGIIHQGRLLRECSLAELQAENRARLRIGVADVDSARRVLTDAGWNVEHVNGHLIVDSHGEQQAADVNALLVSEGHRVHSLGAAPSTLEDVFLGLTGGEGQT